MTISRALRQLPRQPNAGADWRELFADDMQKAIDACASDYVMPDLERIGGVTGWRRASELAAQSGVPMSSHLYPEVSVHLLNSTPTAHWLEYVDWMNPLLTSPLKIVDGPPFHPVSLVWGWHGTTKWCGAMRKFSGIRARMGYANHSPDAADNGRRGRADGN